MSGVAAVKFFGSEGRLKYGPQIPGKDRIYNFIYLRGANIKVSCTDNLSTRIIEMKKMSSNNLGCARAVQIVTFIRSKKV